MSPVVAVVARAIGKMDASELAELLRAVLAEHDIRVAPPVPDGFAVVPTRPTLAMVNAMKHHSWTGEQAEHRIPAMWSMALNVAKHERERT